MSPNCLNSFAFTQSRYGLAFNAFGVIVSPWGATRALPEFPLLALVLAPCAILGAALVALHFRCDGAVIRGNASELVITPLLPGTVRIARTRIHAIRIGRAWKYRQGEFTLRVFGSPIAIGELGSLLYSGKFFNVSGEQEDLQRIVDASMRNTALSEGSSPANHA